MRWILFISLLFALCFLGGCSTKGTDEEGDEELSEGTEISKEDDSLEEDDLSAELEKEEETVADKKEESEESDELTGADDQVITKADHVSEGLSQDIKESKVMSKVESTYLGGAGSGFDLSNPQYYTVKENNETLMWIAFKLYGDYREWKKLSEWNGKGALSQKLLKGQKIKYFSPKVAFSWSPKGTPYLIQYGDYLGKISYKVYGTHKRWIQIFRNNQPMIRDPNLIFAGFTLYYP